MKSLMKFMLLLAVATSVACAEYVPVETYAEADDPVALTAEDEAAWTAVGKNMNVAWGDAW